MHERHESYDVAVCSSHMEQRSQKCYQTVCVPVKKMVPTGVRADDRDGKLHGPGLLVWKSDKEAYKVQVCEYKQEIHKHMISVTSYKTVCEEVMENVPVTTCVQVPCAPVCYTPCCYTPCCYGH